ncbi:MAG TPA: hypothetical protein VGB99_14595 [Acidobacteriota bacterium]
MSLHRACLGTALAAAALLGSGCRKPAQGPQYPITPRLVHGFPAVYHDGPIELGLAWELAADCPPLPRLRAFVHFVDPQAHQVRYFYDHDPPLPTEQWQPGTTVRYDLLSFLEGVEYTGPLEIWVGLHDPKQVRRRAQLQGEARGKRHDAYAIGRLEFRAASQRFLPLYKAGWYEPESAPGLGEWRWTSPHSVASFKAPGRRATLYLKLSFPTREIGAPQSLRVRHNDQTLAQIERSDPAPFIAKVAVPAELAAAQSWFDIALEAEPAFRPSLRGPSADTRELGVKVHHLFLRPSSEDGGS